MLCVVARQSYLCGWRMVFLEGGGYSAHTCYSHVEGDIHVWELLMCGGDIHVWELLMCGVDIHVWELLTCVGDIHVWELLTCVWRVYSHVT